MGEDFEVVKNKDDLHQAFATQLLNNYFDDVYLIFAFAIGIVLLILIYKIRTLK